MNKLFAVALALAATTTACQSRTESATSATAGTGAAPAVALVGQKTPAAPQPPAPADAQSAAFLRRYDLATALQTVSDDEVVQPVVMNGFYGPDHYRMEMVLTKVRRDPAHFNHYLVEGKDRYKGIITPLTGTIDLIRVWTRTDSLPDGEGKTVISYTALGGYELHEDPTMHGAGIFRGRIAADLKVDKQHEVHYVPNYDSPTQGGGLTYTGTWTSLATGQQKPATWVADLMEYRGLKIMDDFFIGERDPSINPKYAKLGWNTYWENKEWWAESPATVAQRQ